MGLDQGQHPDGRGGATFGVTWDTCFGGEEPLGLWAAGHLGPVWDQPTVVGSLEGLLWFPVLTHQHPLVGGSPRAKGGRLDFHLGAGSPSKGPVLSQTDDNKPGSRPAHKPTSVTGLSSALEASRFWRGFRDPRALAATPSSQARPRIPLRGCPLPCAAHQPGAC